MTSSKVWRDSRALRVLGTGLALPGQAIETDELLDRVDRRFGLSLAKRGRGFADKLGIRTRHICRRWRSGRNTAAGAEQPGPRRRGLEGGTCEAGIAANDLDYMIGHTATPSRPVPSNLALVADLMDYAGPYMELRQACTGFANALAIAEGLLAVPEARYVAIVGSETGSVFFDPLRASEDVGQLINLVQMGDGAGAIILGRDEAGPGARLSHVFSGQIGLGREPGFTMLGGGSDGNARQGGLEFEHHFSAVRGDGPALFAAGIKVAAELGWDLDRVDRVIPHQANGHLARQMETELGVPAHKVVVNADRRGNTGSAAIWLALAELRPTLSHGETVLALGAEATKYMYGGFVYRHG